MKKIIFLFVLILLTATALIGCTKDKPEHIDRVEGILVYFDETDLERMYKFIDRFNDNLGDNLLIVSPTMDSGPTIVDLMSNGRQIHVRVDRTRDMHSDRKQVEYVCGEIAYQEDKRDEERYVHFYAADCDPSEEEIVGLFSFVFER